MMENKNIDNSVRYIYIYHLERSNMRKKIIMLCICIGILFFGTLTPVYAQTNVNNYTSVNTKTQKVRWYYRTHNGRKQKRLWSITYGYWKTDWINC